MKAIVIHGYGGPEVLRFEDYPDPIVGAGEALVGVAAASINPVDIMQRSGLTKDYMPIKFPGIIGWDLAGTVLKLGSGVDGLSVGDKVAGWAYQTYAQLCAVKATLLANVPEGLDLVEAAALPLVTTTGSQLISVGTDVKAGQTILVSGAAGGVGRSAVFTAKDRGAFVIAGVLKRQLKDAKDLGADQVLALDDEEAMKGLASVDIVANTVRGKTAEQLLGKVKQGGVFASATGAPDNAAAYPSVRIVAFVSKQDSQTLRYMLKAVNEGKLIIPISRKLLLRDAAEGHIAVGNGGYRQGIAAGMTRWNSGDLNEWKTL